MGLSLTPVAPMFRLALFLMLRLLGGPPLLAAPEPEPVPTAQVTLADLDDEDQYYIHGVFETRVPAMQVWQVLSDYEGLKGVVSGLRSSKVLERRAQVVLLDQVMVGQFLFFSKPVHLLLQVKELAPWRIQFETTIAKPFRHYQGAWQIEPTADGCRVDYTLTVSRGDMAPSFIERKLFRENSRSLLQELRSEVSKRAGQATVLVTATPPPPRGL